ncbi:hypothetical protein POTOM_001028 [Populus tomentosa]|uniref:QWRF motif-containing protein 7 n=1 Tax=Populus tomentosa TaxID=118781 RepID=A0A8X8DH64_POPTO|nr:hypothetical protein POTOM_001028 [Populus tomentosa]
MEYPLTRRRQPPAPLSPSPCLSRSRSEAENHSSSLTTNRSLVNNRSKSTTRSRNENVNPSCNYTTGTSLTNMHKKPGSQHKESGGKDGFVKFLHRGSTSPRNSSAALKRTKSSAGSSQSAWALSPGRSPVFPTPESSPGIGGDKRGKVKGNGGGGGGAMNSVLRYFKQKKVNPIQEEEYHRFRVLYNRLLQWRFVNARADAAMSYVKTVAEDKLFHVWLRIVNTRNIILEKRIQIRKLKHEVKLCQIINPQMKLLNEWAKLEGKNFEAVGRVTRKLSALSVKLPLEEDAKGDVESVYIAISNAAQVMDSIEGTLNKFLSQVEKVLFLITELSSTLQNQDESLEEMEKTITVVAKLVAWEKSVRVHLLQIGQDSEEEEAVSRHD